MELFIFNKVDISPTALPSISKLVISNSLSERVENGLLFSLPVFSFNTDSINLLLKYFLLLSIRSTAFLSSCIGASFDTNPMAPACKNLLAYIFSEFIENISTLLSGLSFKIDLSRSKLFVSGICISSRTRSYSLSCIFWYASLPFSASSISQGLYSAESQNFMPDLTMA